MSVLIDELEHRWQFPGLPDLYAISSQVIGDDPLRIDGKLVPYPVLSVKVGEAERSLAPRLSTYVYSGQLSRGAMVEGTVELRLAVFGSGEAMVRERKLLKHAAKHAHPLPVTAESYYGQSLLAELHRFLQIPQARFRDMAADVFYSRAPHDDKAQVLSRLASDADGLVARPARDYLRSLSLQQEADANLSAEDLPAEPS